MKLRKLWSFGKDTRTAKDIFISKLQIAENHMKLDVSENSKGNVMLIKLRAENSKGNVMLVRGN